MADGGYGAGLFDSEGPKQFAEEVGKISSALTGVQTAFTTFSTAASKSVGAVASAVDALIAKLGQASQLQQGLGASGGGGGGGGGAPITAPNGASGNVGAAGNILVRQGGQWVASKGGGPGG